MRPDTFTRLAASGEPEGPDVTPMRHILIVAEAPLTGGPDTGPRSGRWRMQGPNRGPFLLPAAGSDARRSSRTGSRRKTMSGEMMTGAEMVIRALQDQGVDTLRLSGRRGAADLRRDLPSGRGQARARAPRAGRRPRGRGLCPLVRQGRACVLVTSGPGATNAVTGLTDAMMDSIPIVCITGQVPTHLIGSDAFQECDTVGITRHCTKHNYLVKIDRGPAAHPARGLLRRLDTAGPARSSSTCPKDIQFESGTTTRPTEHPAQDLPPRGQGRRGEDPGGRRADGAAPSGRSSIPAAASSIPGRDASALLRELVAPDRLSRSPRR